MQPSEAVASTKEVEIVCVHLKTEELCSRCKTGIYCREHKGQQACMECELMNLMGICVCEEIRNNTPCEFVEVVDTGE